MAPPWARKEFCRRKSFGSVTRKDAESLAGAGVLPCRALAEALACPRGPAAGAAQGRPSHEVLVRARPWPESR